MKQDKLYVVKRLVDRKELSLHFGANQGQKRSAGRAGTCNNSRGRGEILKVGKGRMETCISEGKDGGR